MKTTFYEFVDYLLSTQTIDTLKAMLTAPQVDQIDCICFSISAAEWRKAAASAINTLTLEFEAV